MTDQPTTTPFPDGTRARDVWAELSTADQRLHLSAPADPEILDLVHAMLEHLWSTHHQIGERERGRFETALIEILANVVEHAYEHDPAAGRRIHVQLVNRGPELVAHLADNGQPMALDMSDVTMPGEMAESGRGLAIASAALDDLSYERIEGRNHWTLLCLLDHA